MASITNSIFPITPTPNNMAQQCRSNTRKRRPIDPPGEDASNGNYYSSSAPFLSSPVANKSDQPATKRIRTVDHSFDALSLRAADPPGFYSSNLGTKLPEAQIDGDEHFDVMAERKPAASGCVAVNDGTTSSTSTAQTNNKRPVSNIAVQYQQLPTSKKMQQLRRLDQSSTGLSDTGNSEMSLEGSDTYSDDESLDGSCDGSCGSVSESSIRNSMYQVVFGRMKGSPTNGATYDYVDSKIEDLIRRSRMEAVLKSKNQKNDNTEEQTDDSAKSMDLG